MSYNNLSKTFRYVNENGDSITFDYDNGFIISKPNGIDTVEVQLTQAQGINQIGGTVEAKAVQPRPVTINGILIDGNKDKLLSVVLPNVSGKLYAGNYYLNVHVTATPVIEARKKFARFQFSMLAPYPYWQKDAETVKTLSGIEPKFKFPWNLTSEYQFGERIQLSYMTIYNTGHVPAPFTVTFDAKDVVANPRITDMKSGKALIINKILVPGERVVVEITHDRTNVTSSVDGSIRGALDLDSDLFRLAVGDNAIKPEADEGFDNLEVKISYADEIVGVTV